MILFDFFVCLLPSQNEKASRKILESRFATPDHVASEWLVPEYLITSFELPPFPVNPLARQIRVNRPMKSLLYPLFELHSYPGN